MPNTARTAADPGLPDDTRPALPRTMEGRIAQWCAWFDVPPPDPSWRTGGEAAESFLLAWSRDAGANLDWIVCGDPHGMARLWRDRELDVGKFTAEVLHLSEPELRLVAGVARLMLEDLVSPEDAPRLVREALGKHRAEADALESQTPDLASGSADAPGERETEVMRLFREWDASQAGWANVPEEIEAEDAYGRRCDEIVERMVAAQGEGLDDFAAKIIAVCGWIDAVSFATPPGERLLAEAAEIMQARGFRYRSDALRA